MNKEHQNPKTQLPRAIEEKPIVYDDIELEEVREVAALPPIHLSPDEIEYAISLFARGFRRGDVVTILRSENARDMGRRFPKSPHHRSIAGEMV